MSLVMMWPADIFSKVLCRFRPEISTFQLSDVNTSHHPMRFFNEWIDHSAFHEAPLGNAIVRFRTSLCRYIPLFALHIFLSSDWLSWCAGRFSRHPWIPLIHPSFKSCHVCRHFSFYPLTNLTPWGCELRRIPWDGEITIKPRAPVTKEGFAESCTSVLHFRMVLPEVGFWVRYGIQWHGPSSLYLSETERWTFQVCLLSLPLFFGPFSPTNMSICPEVKCLLRSTFMHCRESKWRHPFNPFCVNIIAWQYSETEDQGWKWYIKCKKYK